MKYENTGRFMRSLREDKGLTQREIAEAFKIHTQYVSNFERGTCPPPLKKTKKAFRRLKLTPETLTELKAVFLEDVVIDTQRMLAKHI